MMPASIAAYRALFSDHFAESLIQPAEVWKTRRKKIGGDACGH